MRGQPIEFSVLRFPRVLAGWEKSASGNRP